MKRRPTAEDVESEISSLDALDIKTLQNRWRELYGVEPPFKIRTGFLRRSIAYRLQELAFGGLKPATRKQLRRVAELARTNRSHSGGKRRAGADDALAAAIQPRRKTLSPGTRLLREWNGTTEMVDVLSDGFGWHGKTYKTLSAVAVAITGTKWSGPKFFGLIAAKKRTAGLPRQGHRALELEPAP